MVSGSFHFSYSLLSIGSVGNPPANCKRLKGERALTPEKCIPMAHFGGDRVSWYQHTLFPTVMGLHSIFNHQSTCRPHLALQTTCHHGPCPPLWVPRAKSGGLCTGMSDGGTMSSACPFWISSFRLTWNPEGHLKRNMVFKGLSVRFHISGREGTPLGLFGRSRRRPAMGQPYEANLHVA